MIKLTDSISHFVQIFLPRLSMNNRRQPQHDQKKETKFSHENYQDSTLYQLKKEEHKDHKKIAFNIHYMQQKITSFSTTNEGLGCEYYPDISHFTDTTSVRKAQQKLADNLTLFISKVPF